MTSSSLPASASGRQNARKEETTLSTSSTSSASVHGTHETGGHEHVPIEAKNIALAASTAAIVTKSALHPIDTVKCRLQVVAMGSVQSSAAAGVHRSSHPRLTLSQKFHELRTHYKGCWGPRYLYGGLPVKLLMYVPYQTTYLLTYETAKSYLHTTEAQKSQQNHPVRSHLWRTTTAAVAAELGACCIRVPMETVKMRIQATKAQNTLEAFRQLHRNGVRAYARLLIPHTLAHDVPYSITQWVVYETLRPWTKQWHTTMTSDSGDGDGQPPKTPPTGSTAFWHRYGAEILRSFMSGGFSGFVASAVTIPLDNIRTRTVVASATNPSITARGVVRQTLQQEGVRGFFKGGGMRVLWVTLNLACYFPIFELLKHILIERDRN